MFPYKTLLRIIPYAIILLLLVILYVMYLSQQQKQPATMTREAISAGLLVEVEALGKIELVKYTVKDIIPYKKTNPAFMPNYEVLLVVGGEAVGCIDLGKLTEERMYFYGDSLLQIWLPEPEVCYYKLDHSKSKVHDVSSVKLFDKTTFVDEAFKDAERYIYEAARQSGILEQTKVNAQLVLKPIFEKIAQREVRFVFSEPLSTPEIK
jgi:hypothetical protein